MSQRKAIVPVEHPLCYTSSTRPKLSQGPQTLEEQVKYLIESQRIRDLFSEFGYALDASLADPKCLDVYVSLYTDDCRLSLPFGTFTGKQGMAEMVLKAESRFQRISHLSSNMVFEFSDDYSVAHARSTIFVANGLNEQTLDPSYLQGGYYYWTLRKDAQSTQWRISEMFLDIVWAEGDSRGLNEPGAADL